MNPIISITQTIEHYNDYLKRELSNNGVSDDVIRKVFNLDAGRVAAEIVCEPDHVTLTSTRLVSSRTGATPTSTRQATPTLTRQVKTVASSSNGRTPIPSASQQEEGEVVLVLNYTNQSHALFGRFDRQLYVSYKDEVLKKTRGCSYNQKLAFGPGWVFSVKLLEIIRSSLKKYGIPYRALSRQEYKDSLVQPAATATTPEEASFEESTEPPISVTKAKSPAVHSGPQFVVNDYENLEDEETGYVYKKLPLEAGKETFVVIGYQNSSRQEKGIGSVSPLDEELTEECEQKGLPYLTAEMIGLVQKSDRKLATQLKALMERVSDENE